MSESGWYKYVAVVDSMATLLADSGDIFNLEANGTRPYRMVEVRVYQMGSDTLDMKSLKLRRGVITTAAGTAVTEREWDTNGPAPVCVARSLPTTDVASIDWELNIGWNILQSEALWQPTPEWYLPCNGNQDFGVGQIQGAAHTNVGCTFVWEEYVGG